MTKNAALPTRWQAERKENFPTDANLSKRAQAAKTLLDAGGLDPAAQKRQLSLHEIIQLQRKMGLCKAAGTEDLHVGGPSPSYYQ